MSDIVAVDMVGIAGSAYLYGIVLGNYDWLGSVPVMIIAAFLFIPIFWKKKVSTIPEWLGARYNSSVQTTSALIWGIYMPINLGIILYASAAMLNVLLDLNPKVLILSEDKVVIQKIARSTDAKKYDFIYANTINQGIELSKNRDTIIAFINPICVFSVPLYSYMNCLFAFGSSSITTNTNFGFDVGNTDANVFIFFFEYPHFVG